MIFQQYDERKKLSSSESKDTPRLLKKFRVMTYKTSGEVSNIAL